LHAKRDFTIGLKTSIIFFGDDESLQLIKRFGQNIYFHLQHEMLENVLELQLFLTTPLQVKKKGGPKIMSRNYRYFEFLIFQNVEMYL
jgi:hypothetical protein